MRREPDAAAFLIKDDDVGGEDCVSPSWAVENMVAHHTPPPFGARYDSVATAVTEMDGLDPKTRVTGGSAESSCSLVSEVYAQSKFSKNDEPPASGPASPRNAAWNPELLVMAVDMVESTAGGSEKVLSPVSRSVSPTGRSMVVPSITSWDMFTTHAPF
jgi:hypothetical protein